MLVSDLSGKLEAPLLQTLDPLVSPSAATPKHITVPNFSYPTSLSQPRALSTSLTLPSEDLPTPRRSRHNHLTLGIYNNEPTTPGAKVFTVPHVG